MKMWQRAQGENISNPSIPILSAAGMGTGSDYGPFLHHAGIPSVDLFMGSYENFANGVYHSQYDSFYG